MASGAGNGSEEAVAAVAAGTSFLGIKNTDKDAYKDFLQKAAATDFWHDFHHAKSAPILDRLGKSYNVNSGLSIRNYQSKVLALRAEFQAKGATLYDMFKEYETPLMLVDNGDAETFKYSSEDDVLNRLLPDDLDTEGKFLYKYQNIRGKLFNASKENKLNSFPVFPETIKIGPYNHPYTINASPVKNRGIVYNIAPAFEVASNGTINFILMIDASFLSISQLRKLAVDPQKVYNFFIIQSIENEGDPATKIGNFDKSENPNVNVYFLKDTGHKTYYTRYDSETEKGDNSNLFCGCSISAYRDVDGNITADIQRESKIDSETGLIITPPINTTIENLGTASEPSEAGFLAFQRIIMKGENANNDEAMLYYLMKRAGDWCQALCLLDRGRQYTIEAFGNSAPLAYSSASLQEIMNTYGKVEVALLTHDKILLSYALSMGLNVYYTIKVVAAAGGDESSSSVIWLTYFKNTLDSDSDAIINAANEKWVGAQKDIQKISDTISTIHADIISVETLDAAIDSLYSGIASKCIEFINHTKEEIGGFYQENVITTFILFIRAVLDIACKIGEKPQESIKSIIESVNSLNPANANEYFSAISTAETKIRAYLQISTFIKQLYSFNVSQELSYFGEELIKIQELEAILRGYLPLKLKNGSYAEPYQYFLLTTMPAIKKDLDDFRNMFGIPDEFLQALTVDMTKYKGPDIKSERRKEEWATKIQTWYESYRNGLGLPVVQGGGEYTPYNLGVRIPLQTNKYIQTRNKIIPYDIAAFKTSFTAGIKNLYDSLENLQSRLINKAEKIYEEESEESEEEMIREPGLTAYIGELLKVYVGILCDQLNINEIGLNENLTEHRLSHYENMIWEDFVIARRELRSLYIKNSTTVDIGTTITYNDGLGYTALDDCIITTEEIPLWKEYLKDDVNRESEIDNTENWLVIRFLLFNLDIYTNKIHELNTETIEGDTQIYVQKIKAILDVISFILINLDTNDQEKKNKADTTLEGLLHHEETKEKGYISEEIYIASEEIISISDLLNYIAITKVLLILKYNGLVGNGENLDDYQKVRLILLVCPSIEDTKNYFTILLELFEGEHLNLRIAGIFQYIQYNNKIPHDITNDTNHLLQLHIDALKDGFYDFVKEAKAQQLQKYRAQQEEQYEGQFRQRWEEYRGQQANPLTYEKWKEQEEQNEFEQWLQIQEEQEEQKRQQNIESGIQQLKDLLGDVEEGTRNEINEFITQYNSGIKTREDISNFLNKVLLIQEQEKEGKQEEWRLAEPILSNLIAAKNYVGADIKNIINETIAKYQGEEVTLVDLQNLLEQILTLLQEQQQQQYQGGRRKRFQKTRSKPKIRKQTRRRSQHKKYRNKTKRA